MKQDHSKPQAHCHNATTESWVMNPCDGLLLVKFSHGKAREVTAPQVARTPGKTYLSAHVPSAYARVCDWISAWHHKVGTTSEATVSQCWVRRAIVVSGFHACYCSLLFNCPNHSATGIYLNLFVDTLAISWELGLVFQIWIPSFWSRIGASVLAD